MCMSIVEGIHGLLPIWWLAILFVGFAVFAGGPLARASSSRRFALWLSFAFAALLVQSVPVLQVRNCASDVVSDVLGALLGAAVVAVAAVGGIALVVRASEMVVTPAVRFRVSSGAIGGIAAAVGVMHMIARIVQD